MLTQDGELTDIGSWYMGGVATNNIPKSSGANHFKASIGAFAISLIATAFLI